MNARILVVDDDPAIRSTLADVLADDGTLAIELASSAEEAIGLLETNGTPDLVLSDLRMRGLDGMDLLRVLRQRAPAAPVVLMTAYHDVATAVSAMREGAADFLCKPFDLQTLRSVVTRLVGTREEYGGAALPSAHPAATHAPMAVPAHDAVLAGRYAIEAELGRGAMATVFRARDRKHDRSVAVKALRRELVASVGVDRFLQEIDIAARLHHPHVLTLIDSGEWDGVPFFVMPLVEGPTLRDRLEADSPMPIAHAAALLRDVTDALAAAHALGVVHRDVKPENILFCGRHAWIADFGVALALWDAMESTSTTTGVVIGTPHYMAPEQASGDYEIDHRADIYAVGVVAYELLTGRPPFTGETARAVLTAHMVHEPAPLRALQPDVPTGLQETVMHCLAKDPDDRWQTAETLSRDFGRFAVHVDQPS